MNDANPTSRHPHAPPVSGPRQRRLKLLVFVVIFGPMVAFGAYHLARGVQKMIAGEPVGYRSAEERHAEEP